MSHPPSKVVTPAELHQRFMKSWRYRFWYYWLWPRFQWDRWRIRRRIRKQEDAAA